MSGSSQQVGTSGDDEKRSQSETGPVWARSYGERPPKLSRERIVAAAIDIADAEGIQAVSMRRVAAGLGARTMSLYAHIARKEDLLDLMVDEVTSEAFLEGRLPEDWRRAITAVAHRERHVTLKHPWTVDLRTQRPRLGPNGLKHIEQSLAALGGLALDSLSKWRIVTAVDEYVLGHAVSEVLEREVPRREGSSSAELQVLMRPYFQHLVDSGEFPHLAPILQKGLPVDDNTFDRGLNWLLDGIAHEFAQRAADSPA